MEGKKNHNSSEQMAALCRKVAAQGAVLLKNEDAVLPLTADDRVAVFGRCQKDYYRSGTGSGGAVNVLYTTNLVDGLRDNGITVNEVLSASYETWISSHPFDNGEGGWACEPWCQLEMPVTQTLAATAAADSNKAVVVIGRTAGEDRDNAATEGSYYLTSTEKEMLRNVYSHFKNVIVVLNVSNIIDMNFMQDSDHIKAVVYAWQGGMEGGN
ncbi:MAG: glycoside hydrolase family 3 C-terminal domain-containing protein, partial [Lachnospiraceae bacterium]|nr:glycoside hydrolase family 3 C-terminal domain-containing protein [Lachnospiraceae bacterium]